MLGAGLAAWALTRRHPSLLVCTAGMMAGTAVFAGRAASGGSGLSKALRLLPIEQRTS